MSTVEATIAINSEEEKKFPSWTVSPVNDLEEGINTGHYTGYCPNLAKKPIILQQVEGEKQVYLVLFNEMIGENEYTARLAEYGFKPCKNGPNYLLSLMKQVTESEMPEELWGKHIVAAENNLSSVFLDRRKVRSFLYVDRESPTPESPSRELHLATIEGGWDDEWVFLAEEM